MSMHSNDTTLDDIEKGDSENVLQGRSNYQLAVDVEEQLALSYNTIKMPDLPKPLSLKEKKYLLAVERGDTTTTKQLLQQALMKKDLNVNCMDPMGRGALLMAIEAEDLPMVELLLVMGVETKDGLLHAIDQEFVEAVELLLEHEELVHKPGDPYSWEKVDRNIAIYTPEITPLILAAHKNNYEVLKILFDRGATLPMPHDIRCGCDECVRSSLRDSLRHSMSRIGAYKALASPSLIALSSTDPILTAFELSWELRSMAADEPEFKTDYTELRALCQEFAVDLLTHTRTSQELAIILNHDPDEPPPVDVEDYMSLARLELAIHYKQKEFVAHPNVQQLLSALWYDGLPGFRRKSLFGRMLHIVWVALMFPFYSILYMVAPNTKTGQLMKKPFMKFLIHANSYLFFLLLLILMSQRIETVIIQMFGSQAMNDWLAEELIKQRGNRPTVTEIIVVIYIFGLIWEELKDIWQNGFSEYMHDMWNIIDWIRNCLYVSWMGFKMYAYFAQQAEIAENPASAYIPREEWDAYDPQLMAEGLCSAANVFSALKLVHMFSINPHLGPLQISLGRMINDIIQFFFIYSLVLFAFACGLNQLLWYYADLEEAKCFSLPSGEADWVKSSDQCYRWRRFANVFESCQSLFWASFGMIGLEVFELSGIKEYTRFWALLMFGSYSCINVVVLLNLLIAMMSNSFSAICERSDTEWKFARTKLWMNYFESGATVPPPFNIIPTYKGILKTLGIREKDKKRKMSTRRKEKRVKERDFRYLAVIRALVWRYITKQHRDGDTRYITEDDVNEVKNDISAFRHELLNIFRNNGIEVDQYTTKKQKEARKARQWERRLMKNFHVTPVSNDEIVDEKVPESEDAIERFKRVAKLSIGKLPNQDWDDILGGKPGQGGTQIGRSTNENEKKHRQSLKRAIDEIQSALAEGRTPVWSPAHSPEPSAAEQEDVPPDLVSLTFLQLFKKTRDRRSMLEKIHEDSERNTPEPRDPSSNSLPLPTMKEAKKMVIENEDEKKTVIGNLIKKKKESVRRKTVQESAKDLITFEVERASPKKEQTQQSSSTCGEGDDKKQMISPQLVLTPSTPQMSGDSNNRKASLIPASDDGPDTAECQASGSTPSEVEAKGKRQRSPTPTSQRDTKTPTPPGNSKSPTPPPSQNGQKLPSRPASRGPPPTDIGNIKRAGSPTAMMEAQVIPEGVVGKAQGIFENKAARKQQNGAVLGVNTQGVGSDRRKSRPEVCSPLPASYGDIRMLPRRNISEPPTADVGEPSRREVAEPPRREVAEPPRRDVSEPPPPGVEMPSTLQKRSAPRPPSQGSNVPPAARRASQPVKPVAPTPPPIAAKPVSRPPSSESKSRPSSSRPQSAQSKPESSSSSRPQSAGSKAEASTSRPQSAGSKAEASTSRPQSAGSKAESSTSRPQSAGSATSQRQSAAASPKATSHAIQMSPEKRVIKDDDDDMQLIIKTVKSPCYEPSRPQSPMSLAPTPLPESPIPSAEPTPETKRKAENIEGVTLEKVRKKWY